MINNEIKAKTVKLVQEDKKGLVEMKLSDAIKLAEDSGLDVICINDKGDVPIVKIGDYNKFKYEKSKKEKENKKKARLNAQDLKEISLRDSIADHDLKIKARNIDRLLRENNKVKVYITYKGRTIKIIDKGIDKLNTLKELITEKFNLEKEPKIEGNRVVMLISPHK